MPPVATSIEQLLERQWNEGQSFLLQQGAQGDGEDAHIHTPHTHWNTPDTAWECAHTHMAGYDVRFLMSGINITSISLPCSEDSDVLKNSSAGSFFGSFFFLVFSYSLAFVTANAECCLHLGKALQTLETHRKVVATRDSNSLCDKVWCAVFYEYNIVTETKQIRFYWNVGKNVIYIHMKSPQKHLRNCRTWQQIKIFWLTSILWQSHRDNSLYFHKILKDTLCSLGKSINLRMVIFTLMKWF